MKYLCQMIAAFRGLDRRTITSFLAVYTLVAALAATLLGSWTGAIALILSAAFALLMLRFDDVTEFKFYGLQAKLKQSIDEANATITQLRQLAAALSGPVVWQLALSGQFMKYQTLASKQENINKIIDCLKVIGVSDTKIGEALEPWKIMVGHHISGILEKQLDAADKEKAEEFRKLRSSDKLDESPEKVLAFAKALPTALSEKLSATIALYEEVWKTGKAAQPQALDVTEQDHAIDAGGSTSGP